MIRLRWPPLLAVVLAVLIFAIYQGGALPWHLFGFIAILAAIASVVRFAPWHPVRVVRDVASGPYRARDSVTVALNVSTTARWLWPHLVVEDQLPASLNQKSPRFVINQLSSHETRLTYEVPNLPRGVYALDAITLTAGDAFGLVDRSLVVHAPEDIVVWPTTVSLGVNAVFGQFGQGERRGRRTHHEESFQLRGVREYVTGDRLSRIHWKSSAHTGNFKVKQFETATAAEFTIVLDRASHFATADDWELALSTVGSVLECAAYADQSIGLGVVDRPDAHFLPASGAGAFREMMNFLSQLPYQSPVERAVWARWGDTQLIVVTSSEKMDEWRSQADLLIPVGAEGLQHLSDLPRRLSPLTAEGGGRR